MARKTLTFDEFVAAQEQTHERVNWNDRKNQWLRSLDDLYSAIENEWLSEYKVKYGSKIELHRGHNTVKEFSFIDMYEAPNLSLWIGDLNYNFIPFGLTYGEGYGRVDVLGPNGSVSLIQKPWGVWKIVSNFSERTQSLNAKTFRQLLLDLGK